MNLSKAAIFRPCSGRMKRFSAAMPAFLSAVQFDGCNSCGVHEGISSILGGGDVSVPVDAQKCLISASEGFAEFRKPVPEEVSEDQELKPLEELQEFARCASRASVPDTFEINSLCSLRGKVHSCSALHQKIAIQPREETRQIDEQLVQAWNSQPLPPRLFSSAPEASRECHDFEAPPCNEVQGIRYCTSVKPDERWNAWHAI